MLWILAVGADTTLLIQGTPECLAVGSGTTQKFLAVVQSSAIVGAARFDYTFSGLRSSAPTSTAARATPSTAAPPSSRLALDHELSGRSPDQLGSQVGRMRPTGGNNMWPDGSRGSAQAEWDRVLRERERLLAIPAATERKQPPAALRRVPRIGESREFKVIRDGGGFDRVTATVRFVSERAVLYEDVTAAGSLTQEDVELFGDRFDDPIYPVITENFGSPSDLDGNGRVVILFTPAVNRRSPPGSSDFVGGFFFALDLMSGLEHSNEGEVVYVLVPDPTGVCGNVRDIGLIRSFVPPILAHEFQHMVHHNERIIESAAPNRDAAWLSEGLAHMAEDLVGAELRERGRHEDADEFQRGNRRRASLFLTQPSEVSLISAAGQGSLEERGAAWLFLEYLRGRVGSADVFWSLTATVLTGTDNVESVTGRDWAGLFSDWSAAIELERQVFERGELPLRNELRFLGFDLMAALALGGDGFPSRPATRTSGDFSDSGRLWSSSGACFLLRTGSGGLGTNLSGLNGGPPSGNSGLLLRVVRVF